MPAGFNHDMNIHLKDLFTIALFLLLLKTIDITGWVQIWQRKNSVSDREKTAFVLSCDNSYLLFQNKYVGFCKILIIKPLYRSLTLQLE